MTTRIKLKRGSGVPNESDLQEHEVAMDVSTGTIYVGSSSTDSGTDCTVLTEKNPANTDSISEGSSNLYFTNARADARAQLKIDALVDSAPGTLDTLNELAAALGDDASFSTTVTNSIATKLALAGGTMTGALTLSGAPTSTLHAATKSYVDSAVTTGTGSITTSDVAEGSNLYYTDARAQAVSINNLSEDSSPQLGGDLDLNGARNITDGSDNLITYDESDGDNELRFYAQNGVECLRLIPEGDFAQIQINSSDAYVHLDGSGSIYANVNDALTFVREEDSDDDAPSMIIGRNDPDDRAVNLHFAQYDGGAFSNDQTSVTAGLSAFANASDNKQLSVMVDDDGGLEECFRFKLDGGNITNISKGKFEVHDSNGDNIFEVEDGEPISMRTPGSQTTTASFTHELATNDTSHTMVKFNIDYGSDTPTDVDFGFTAETIGDNITGDDEGFAGRLEFGWRTDGKHSVQLQANTYEDDVFHSREAILATNQVTTIGNMMKMQPITTDTTGNRPGSASAGTLYFNTTSKILQYYTNQWRDLTNAKGMMFTGANGVLHFYDGSAWKNVLTGASI